MLLLSISSMSRALKQSSHCQICSIPKKLGLYQNIFCYTQKLKQKFFLFSMNHHTVHEGITPHILTASTRCRYGVSSLGHFTHDSWGKPGKSRRGGNKMVSACDRYRI
jgi:hypothetical protein